MLVARTRKFLIPIKYRDCNFFAFALEVLVVLGGEDAGGCPGDAYVKSIFSNAQPIMLALPS